MGWAWKSLESRLKQGVVISSLLALTGCTILDDAAKIALFPVDLLVTGTLTNTLGDLQTFSGKSNNFKGAGSPSSSYSSAESSSSQSGQYSEAYLAKKSHVDVYGNLISNGHYLRYGQKPLEGVIDESMAQIRPSVYNLDEIFTVVNPNPSQNYSNSGSSDGWQLASFFLGLLPMGKNVTPQQGYFFDMTSSAAGRQAIIEGQKEAAGIIREGMQPPQQIYIRQNLTPRGPNGAILVKNGRNLAILTVGNKEWEDIDRNGTISINELSVKPRISKYDKVYAYGAGTQGLDGAVYNKIIGPDNEVVYTSDTGGSVLSFGNPDNRVGKYQSVWYFESGQFRGGVVGVIPFEIVD